VGQGVRGRFLQLRQLLIGDRQQKMLNGIFNKNNWIDRLPQRLDEV
jgi:hypothetical protein